MSLDCSLGLLSVTSGARIRPFRFCLLQMLPPLNLSESKGDFFSRKRTDGRNAAGRRISSPLVRRQTVSAQPPPHTSRTHDSSSSNNASLSNVPAAASSHPASTALDEMSMIPREFFVFETNAVLPVRQYPPSQYHSSFNPQSLWETIVFPALSPQTRQQVLYLRQALEKMRAALPDAPESDQHTAPTLAARTQIVEYTKHEFRIYSLCFHELIRQIKFICKEQSELLREIREHYDAALARTTDQIHHLNGLVDKQQQQIGDLVVQHEQALRSNAALLEQALRTRSVQEQGQLGRRNCTCCRRKEGEGDEGEGSDDDDSDCDEEEIAWRRQRRNCVQLDHMHRARRRNSLEEENVAAARLQSVYQKYNMRKEQHRLALRKEKHVAALDIQRSYRGFKERQLVLHRRAVVQVILKRREQFAAIELLQANVRAYLMKRKKSKSNKAKRLAEANAAALMRERHSLGSASAHESESDESASAATNDANPHEAALPNEQPSDPTAILTSFLRKFSELAGAISKLQARGVAATSTPGLDSSNHDNVSDTEEPGSCNSDESSALSSQIEAKIKQAEDLVELFHSAVRSLNHQPCARPLDDQHSASERRSLGNPDTTNDRSPVDASPAVEKTLSQATSTSSLDLHLLPFEVFADSKEQHAENRLTSERRESGSKRSPKRNNDDITIASGDDRAESSPNHDDTTQQHNGDLHLDETLWDSTFNAVRLDDTESIQLRNAELLADLLSSRDTKKKLVWLKQFISDTYDTIVGKLSDVSPRLLAKFIKFRCALALSFDEWHQYARVSSWEAVDPLAASSLSFNLSEIIREHFHCHHGLKHLVDNAMANLTASLENFMGVDPDVKRFHAFLHQERSHDEFLFYCACRYLASRCDTGVTSAISTELRSRQPVFHPQTMREIVELPQALRIARSLFRVDDEAHIQAADAGVVEIENAVYRKYQPSSGFSQFEAVVSKYAPAKSVAPDSPSSSVEHPDSSYGRSIASSPLPLAALPPGSMVRPSNVNQFHSKQFNAVASRSPLVRRHQKSPSTGSSTASSGGTTPTHWVHFDEFIDLLLKYRSEMNHFHLFTRWIRDLYATTTAAEAIASGDRDPQGVQLLDHSAFADALVPYSLGPTERELTNIFHNALKQRSLQQWMPPRVFVSVVLLMLRNGLLSVSSCRPQDKVGKGGNSNRSGRDQSEEKRWMRLALKWRTHEAAFEAGLEAIYESPSGDQATATRLLELRNELYTLFIQSTGTENLQRAEDLCELIVMGLTQSETQDRVDEDEDEVDDDDDRIDEFPTDGGGGSTRPDRSHEGSAWESDSTM